MTPSPPNSSSKRGATSSGWSGTQPQPTAPDEKTAPVPVRCGHQQRIFDCFPAARTKHARAFKISQTLLANTDLPRRLIIFVRHAQSEKNVRDHHGHNTAADYALTREGISDARDLASQLSQAITVGAVFSSNSLAPWETASEIARSFHLQPQALTGFHAVNVGILAGMPMSDFRSKYPDLYEQTLRFERGELHPKDLMIPGREDFLGFVLRVTQCLTNVSKGPFPCIVVGHMSVLRMALNIIGSHGVDLTTCKYLMPVLGQLSLSIASVADSLADWQLVRCGIPPFSAVTELQNVMGTAPFSKEEEP